MFEGIKNMTVFCNRFLKSLASSSQQCTSNDFFKKHEIVIEIGVIYEIERALKYVNLEATFLEKTEYMYHMIFNALRVLKMYVLSVLEML